MNSTLCFNSFTYAVFSQFILSFFAIGTKDGFKIFDARNGRLCYEKSELSVPIFRF